VIGRFVVVAALAVGLRADADEIDGKHLFLKGAVPACAICHTLKDAGAEGNVGPVLDELKPDAARVEKAIRDGIGAMPPYKTLSDEQVKAIAGYVARATGAAN